METYTIAVGGANCGTSPVLPYIGETADGAFFTRLCKRYLIAALVRCGFDAIDISKSIDDPQDVIIPTNRQSADGAVVISYSAFGSRRSFNDVRGSVVRYSLGRFAQKSRVLAEDVCAKLGTFRDCVTSPDGAFGAATCKAVTVDAGYLTYFDDAKLVRDPDFAVAVAEHTAMGLCENFDMPYIGREELSQYPRIGASIGKRGRSVKILQALLAANGYELTADGVFGKATEISFKTFCLNNGVKNDDGKEVWKKLLLIAPSALESGSKDAFALYVQRKLRAKLYDAPISGTVDAQTLSALGEFLSDVSGTRGDEPINAVSENAIKILSAVGGGKPRLF